MYKSNYNRVNSNPHETNIIYELYVLHNAKYTNVKYCKRKFFQQGFRVTFGTS